MPPGPARRLHGFAAHGAAQSSLAHEAFNGTTGDRNAFPVELPPDLVGAIDLKIDLPDAFDLADQHFIALSASATQFRIPLSGSMAPIRGRGNLQLLADRLDPETLPVFVDKGLHDLKRRSSSAWAKRARQPQNLIGLLQFAVLAFQLLDPLRFRGGHPVTLPGIPLVLPHPIAQRLRAATDLRGNRFNGCPLRSVVAARLEHHPYRTFPNLGRKLR